MTTNTPIFDDPTRSTRRREWEAWRAERDAGLAAPHGWLSLTGLYWLDEDPTAVADLSGLWSATAEEVVRTVDDERTVWTPKEGAPGLLVAEGDRAVEIIRRTGTAALRIRDPRAATRQEFTGVPVFDYDENYVVPAVLEEFPAGRTLVGAAVVAGLEHRHAVAGELRFDLHGSRQRLTVFRGGAGRTVLFTDATSGISTTGTTRSIAVGEPDTDGRLVLDLNFATNLPCAFTDHATCPLPPPENRLPVPVEAGEKDPR